MNLLDFDDASGAIGIHTLGGVWGLFAAGLLTSQAGYKESYGEFYSDASSTERRSVFCRGVFYGGEGNQLAANIVFILATLAWSFTIMLLAIGPLWMLFPSEFDCETELQAICAMNTFHNGDDEKMAALKAREQADARAEMASSVNLKQEEMKPLPPIAVLPPSKPAPTAVAAEEKQSEFSSSTAQTPLATKPASSLLSAAGGVSGGGFGKLVSSLSTVSNAAKLVAAAAQPAVPDQPSLTEIEADEQFEKLNGYSWDIAIVFKAPEIKADGTHKKKLTFMASQMSKKAKTGDEPNIKSPIEVITVLILAGLEVRVFYSMDKTRMFCKVRIPLSVLRTSADLSDTKLLLDSEALKCAVEAGWEGMREGKKIKIAPMNISDGKDEHLTSYSPFVHIYSAFDEVEDAPLPEEEEEVVEPTAAEGSSSPRHDWPNMFAIAPGLKHGVRHGFGPVQRIKIMQDMMTHEGEKGCGLNFEELINPTNPKQPQQILAWYPLHDEEKIEKLRTHWLGWDIMPWKSPTDDIRDYFGEQIGLYFHFLSHYCTSLGSISFFGVLVVVHLAIVSVQYGSLFGALRYMYSLPVYCFLITIWALWFLETWAAKERNVALRWGMVGFEAAEKERPEFHGKPINSWIDGSYPTKAFDRIDKGRRLQLSSSSLGAIACIVVGVFASTFFLKFWLKGHNQTQYSVFADIINALSIMLLDFLYKKFAVYMTHFENHRTDTQYEDSIILKLFIFGFFNSYCPSIYIAFIKQLIGDPCTLDSCMGELGQTMLIIFGSRLLASSVVKIVVPRFTRWLQRRGEALKMRKSNRRDGGAAAKNTEHVADGGAHSPENLMDSEVTIKTSTEEQCDLEEYADVFDDYNELSVQFGYICLFAPAFPLAPLLSFMSNFAEIRADGFKVLKQMRRAWPHGAEDIGTWATIFEALSILSVMSNAGLIFFTMDLFDGTDETRRLGFFVAYIIGVLFLRQAFGQFVNQYPEEVDIQIARQQVLTDKVIKKIADEDLSADFQRLRRQRLKAKGKVAINLLPTDRHEEDIKRSKLESETAGGVCSGSRCSCSC